MKVEKNYGRGRRMTEMINQNEHLLDLEQSLKNRLYPVRPDRSFVGSLQKKLEESPLFRKKRHLATTLLTIAGGLVIGTAVFLIGRELLGDSENS